MWLRMRRSSLGLLDMDALRATSEMIGMVVWRRGNWFVRRQSSASGQSGTTRGVRGSHAVA